jgi:hypothetical protein
MSASHAKSTHLLRALLREATYLPDAVARQYFHRYIVHRFKAYQPKENATASLRTEDIERYRHRSFKRRQLSIIHERTSKLQKKARKGLHFLRRANQGEIPCLQKVLFFAYGRMGRRKYALLSDVLKPDPIMDGGRVLAAADMKGPAPLQELYFSNKQYLQYFDAPKPASNGNYVISISDRYSRLRAVLKSQCQRGLSIHREIKGPALKTPTHNVWMRPMPIVRARNNVCRWYAQTMDRLLPPLPPAEWDKIRAMVYGEERVSFVKRRTPVAASTANVEDPLAEIFQGLRLDKLGKADRPRGIWRPHNITLKFMQRLYSCSCAAKSSTTRSGNTGTSSGASPSKPSSPICTNCPPTRPCLPAWTPKASCCNDQRHRKLSPTSSCSLAIVRANTCAFPSLLSTCPRTIRCARTSTNSSGSVLLLEMPGSAGARASGEVIPTSPQFCHRRI